MSTKIEKIHWVHDYETLSNCFLGCFTHYKKDVSKVFTIGLLRNDLPELLEFLDDNIKYDQWHISYNGLAFDAQITEYILKNRGKLLKLSGEEAAAKIYQKAQNCIERSSNNEWQEWSENRLSIKQIDVFKLNHWDNPAKRSSLKWVQCSMNWFNVQDMPIEHTAKITTVKELKEISSYCRNDVASTKKIMELSSKQIALRGALTKEYKIPLYSASEPKISKELFLHFLEKETGIKKWELRKMQTHRSVIDVGSLILPYIKFQTPEFTKLLDTFQGLRLNPMNLKGSFGATVNYRGVKTDFGLGGVHGAKRGIYEPEDWMMIITSDVVSYYPNLAIRNKWSPAHLPAEEFSRLYEWFFDERRKIPKSDPRNYVYKIILNSTYGLSNDINSFLYDPEFTMRITVNGQLSLMMLYENIAENIPGAIPIMQNTDGVEFMIPKKYKEKYLEICKEWEEQTKLELEHGEYQKMIVPDVNNYIAIDSYQETTKEKFYAMQAEAPENLYKKEEGKFYYAKTKCKGRFAFKDLPLHKNKSNLIIKKAIYYFFVHGVKPEVTLEKSRDIFDFCGQKKVRGRWKFQQNYVKDGDVITEDLQKTLRYYISNKGSKIIKVNLDDKRTINLDAGPWQQTIYNVQVEKQWKEYNINLKFYLKKIKKELEAMHPELFKNQINLF